MFRVIIAGSRDFNDYDFLCHVMDRLLSNYAQEDIQIVCGMAKGADTCGEHYAKEHGYKIRYFKADWDCYGTAAGPIRNEEMARNADALVAFWDGKSPGTKSMIQLAQKYNLQTRVKKYK
ncbi:MAG: DUF2493 domain-containing protein [Lachnospiraceae bacterium]